jgi:hypothetical protein
MPRNRTGIISTVEIDANVVNAPTASSGPTKSKRRLQNVRAVCSTIGDTSN